MEWFNKYDPGFMCVGRKHHPLGNERHTICCGLTYILWRSHTVEGKDCPGPLGQKEYNKLWKMVSLMLRIYRPIFGSRKAVVLDSGFCVTKGVYAAALVKKQRYFPKGVPGDLIDTHFEYK